MQTPTVKTAPPRLLPSGRSCWVAGHIRGGRLTYRAACQGGHHTGPFAHRPDIDAWMHDVVLAVCGDDAELSGTVYADCMSCRSTVQVALSEVAS